MPVSWGPCEARARTGRRCRKSARLRIPFSTRESVEAAVRTGWPMLLPGMRQPEYAGERLLCGAHGRMYHDKSPRLVWARGRAIAPADVSAGAMAEQQERLREWQSEQK